METVAEPQEGARTTGRLVDYARLVKIEHALFSLPMFVAGALLAGPGRFPSWLDWLLIAVAGTAARSLALALNRYIDRRIDLANPRTRIRELPAGRLSPQQVGWFMVFNLIVYAGAAWLIAPICLYLAWIPLVVFVAYPYMKRFTVFCHFGVGAGLALAPLGGYLAAAKAWPVSGVAWLLGLVTWLWVTGFDIIYAQLDVDFDREQNLFSLPKRMGRKALLVSAALHAGAVVVLVGLWIVAFGRNAWLLIPLGAIALLFLLEHRFSDRVEFAAFRLNTLVGFVLLAFVLLGVYG